MSALRAITLHPWWAWSIVKGSKRLEYRTRPLPKTVAGELVALHAGAAPASVSWTKRERDAEALAAPIVPWKREGFGLDPYRGLWHGSAIVALVRFTGTVPTEDLDMPWRGMGYIGWRIGDVIELPKPVTCTGKQGWWTVDQSTAEEVLSQKGVVR